MAVQVHTKSCNMMVGGWVVKSTLEVDVLLSVLLEVTVIFLTVMMSCYLVCGTCTSPSVQWELAST